jgi:hypothetical protein
LDDNEKEKGKRERGQEKERGKGDHASFHR